MSQTTSGIYAITSPSGRRYIGSTLNFKKRWRQHLTQLRAGTHHSRALQAAFNKYGEENLRFSQLELAEPKQLLTAEQRYFDDAKPRELYNSSLTAGNCLGVKHSPETRAKLSKIRKGRRHSAEAIAKMKEAKMGVALSERTKKKLSEIKRTQPNPRNTSGVAGVSATKAGLWMARAGHGKNRISLGSFETIREAVEALERYSESPGDYVKPPRRPSVVRHSPESLRKMSEAQKRLGPVTTETKKKLSEALKGRRRSAESVARAAETLSLRKSKTGQRGVSLLKSGRFAAQVGYVKLGTFKTVEEAAAARAAYMAAAQSCTIPRES